MESLEEAGLCYPQLLNSSCRRPIRPRAQAVFLYTLLYSIALLTVILNLMVIISISHFRQLRSPTNILLLSLAFSDLLIGLLVMPVEAIRFIEACWILGSFMCAMSFLVGFILTSASVGNMVLISVDRYVAICYPLQYTAKITQSRVKISVCMCWACSVFYNGIVLKGHLQQPDKLNSCYGECVVVIDHITGAVDVVFSFIGPCTAIVVLYMRVFVVAVSQARAMHSQIKTVMPGMVTLSTRKSERKAARTLGIVITVFLLCFCPYYYPSIAGQDTSNSESSWGFVAWLLLFSSCVNPLIYAFFYPWFRKAIKLIVTLEILEEGSCEANMI